MAAGALAPVATATRSAPDLETVRYYAQGFSPAIQDYLVSAITAALDKTMNDYGPYRLDYFATPLSSRRAAVALEQGKDIDLAVGSSSFFDTAGDTTTAHFEFPFFFDLIGLRRLITSANVQQKLKSVSSPAEFKTISVGQHEAWTDNKILRSNGFTVVEAQKFPDLFPMLSKNRFDVLPLSLLEADTALGVFQAAHPELIISSDLYMFYPLPFFVFTPPSRPALAHRMRRGLKVALHDNTLAQLFEQHFGDCQEKIRRNRGRLMLLQNPYLSPLDNEALSARFLTRYGSLFDVLQ